jgi:amidase
VGGSSGGAAALVAAGVVPLAHGNDGGGSIRIPASCTGTVGLKPSRGRFSGRPDMEQLPVKIGHEGVLSRSVRDTATLFYEMGKIRQELPPIPLVTGPSEKRLRIGVFVEGMSGIPVDEQTRLAILDAAKQCEDLGHRVELISFPFDEQFGYDFVRYWAALSFAIKYGGKQAYGPTIDKSLIEPIGQELASLLPGFALKMPATIRRLKKFQITYEEVFTDYDILMSPVTACAAPEIGYLGPNMDGYEHLVRLIRFASYTAIQNVSGAPAMSLPLAATPENVPIGVQFAGPFGSEERLLHLAFELESAVGWH